MIQFLDDGILGDPSLAGRTRPLARSLAALATTLLLSACAASSGAVMIAPGIYGLTELRAQAAGGGERAQQVVLAEAAGFCQQQGLAIRLLTQQPAGDPRSEYWPTAWGATFQCVTRTVSNSAAPASPAATELRR